MTKSDEMFQYSVECRPAVPLQIMTGWGWFRRTELVAVWHTIVHQTTDKGAIASARYAFRRGFNLTQQQANATRIIIRRKKHQYYLSAARGNMFNHTHIGRR